VGRRLVCAAIVVGLATGVAATFVGGRAAAASGPARLRVVAAENFWGSIVKQLAGSRASVSSVITNPNTDPHDYEPKPSDGRAIASARYVIENGIGYDTWVQKLLDASPDRSRRVLNVGEMLGLKAGGNPHQWYSPASVDRFVARVASDLEALDPKNAGYYAAQKAKFETTGLAEYHALIAEIDQKYAGTPVGASESIFSPLAAALELHLVTPESFLDAVAEGTDPTGADKATVDRQIQNKEIKVFVFNSQNATPDVRTLVKAAKAHGIPVTAVTETLAPASASFQTWQVEQLRKLDAALAKAAGP
jgi:zinc/manganese transport system substrate-binding protein